MTTTVRVDVHCGPDKEVQLVVFGEEKLETIYEGVFQDGDKITQSIYGDHVLAVKEVKKSSEIKAK